MWLMIERFLVSTLKVADGRLVSNNSCSFTFRTCCISLYYARPSSNIEATFVSESENAPSAWSSGTDDHYYGSMRVPVAIRWVVTSEQYVERNKNLSSTDIRRWDVISGSTKCLLRTGR